MAAEEELKQQERERQATAALEQVEKEQERVKSERPPEKATHIEYVTWAERITEAEKKRKQAEEDAKRVHHGVGVGGGWEVVEGKAMRTVEVTTHFTTPLTDEEKKSLPEKIRMVSDLVAVKRRAEGLEMWNIEATIDTQVCQNKITWRVSKVVRGTTEAEVSVELGTQATVVYGEERMKGAWVTNRKAIAVFVRGLRGGKDDKKEELQGKLELNNPGIKWGNRSAVVTNVSPFLWGMKAEVVSAEEAVALIGKGVCWDGKKYEAELWKNARLRALGGSQGSGRGSPPSGPGGNRGIGGGYSGPGPRNTRPVHGLSNVCCYNCRGFGPYARTCTIRSRNASGYIGERGNKRQGGPAGAIGNAPKGPRTGYAMNNNWATGNGGWAAEGSGSADNRGQLWG